LPQALNTKLSSDELLARDCPIIDRLTVYNMFLPLYKHLFNVKQRLINAKREHQFDSDGWNGYDPENFVRSLGWIKPEQRR
jgi:hypothetical protein